MTYETVRDAAKELALNAIATEKRDESVTAASVAFESIAIHERSAAMIRHKDQQQPEMVVDWVEQLRELDASLM